MKGKISIVITCYNDEAFIEKAIQSAIDQTYRNTEIIVVDDGSNSQTKQVLNIWENKVDLLITQENKGVSVARNIGITAAKGEYILVLDGDDYFEPSFCERAFRIFKEKSEVKLVTCYARWFRNEKDFQIFKPNGGELKDYLIRSCAIGNSLFRKKDWLSCGGYDEKMNRGWEDWEFFIRLHGEGGITYVIPEVLFHYRKRSDSKTSIANFHKYDLLEYIYLKNAYLYIQNFDTGIKALINKLKQEQREKERFFLKPDFKIGHFILKPFRLLKSLYRN